MGHPSAFYEYWHVDWLGLKILIRGKAKNVDVGTLGPVENLNFAKALMWRSPNSQDTRNTEPTNPNSQTGTQNLHNPKPFLHPGCEVLAGKAQLELEPKPQTLGSS